MREIKIRAWLKDDKRMVDLIEKIHELKDYENYDYDQAITDVEILLDQYNIITAPKTIKLSEIVDKMNCYVKRNENDIHLYDIEEDLFDEYDSFESYSLIIENNKITNILLSQCDEFKWLYTLWIAGTIIEDDLKDRD